MSNPSWLIILNHEFFTSDGYLSLALAADK